MKNKNYLSDQIRNNIPKRNIEEGRESVRMFVEMLKKRKINVIDSLHSLDIDEIIKVTGEAYELISVLRHNLIKRSRLSERDEFHEWAFPSGQREKMMLMGFPIEKD